MKIIGRAVTMTLGLGVLVALFAAEANAGCSSPPSKAARSLWQQPLGEGQARLIPTAFGEEFNGRVDNASIVGLWKFSFTAKGNTGANAPPDGAPIDAGYVTWHSDGTELMNSGRAPTTGSFCMGVWQQVGAATYKLNHFALAWEFDANTPPSAPGVGGADFVGPGNIREVVTVARGGMSYQGTFSLVQYASDNKTILADIVGTVQATRVTVNSTIED